MLKIGSICKDRKNGKIVEVVNFKRFEATVRPESYVVFRANINAAKGTYDLKELKFHLFGKKYEIVQSHDEAATASV